MATSKVAYLIRSRELTDLCFLASDTISRPHDMDGDYLKKAVV
jgi:hypothetical protein